MSRPNYQRTASTNVRNMDHSRPLEGRLAIVTGGARGIGAAIVRNLASKGASLVIGYTSESSTQKTKDLIAEVTADYGIQAISVQADMANVNAPRLVVESARNHFKHPTSGRFEISIIVANAAVAANAPLEDETAENFDKLYHINVRAPMLLVQAAMPYLPHDRSGRIVNISSVSASMGLIHQTVYGGTKAAVEAMTRTWSRELSERATVNAVNPGPVATDMYAGVSPEFEKWIKPMIQATPLMKERPGIDDEKYVKAAPESGGRPGYDYEIAGVVGMLCSPESGWCTGSVICANGGMKFST